MNDNRTRFYEQLITELRIILYDTVVVEGRRDMK